MRYQECNRLVKLWRCRHYVYVPFKYVFYLCVPFEVINPEKNETFILKGKELFITLVSIAQLDMKWSYTNEEVMERIKEDRTLS